LAISSGAAASVVGGASSGCDGQSEVGKSLALTSNSLLVLYTHVKTGRRASVMPAKLAETLGLADTVRSIPIIDPVVTYSIGLVVPQRDPMTPLIAALVHTAREVAPTLESRRSAARHLWSPRNPCPHMRRGQAGGHGLEARCTGIGSDDRRGTMIGGTEDDGLIRSHSGQVQDGTGARHQEKRSRSGPAMTEMRDQSFLTSLIQALFHHVDNHDFGAL
jgi:hypothetical protein